MIEPKVIGESLSNIDVMELTRLLFEEGYDIICNSIVIKEPKPGHPMYEGEYIPVGFLGSGLYKLVNAHTDYFAEDHMNFTRIYELIMRP